MLLICAISVVGPKKYRRKDFVIRLSEAGDFNESSETFAEVAREKFILTLRNRRLTHWKSGTNAGKNGANTMFCVAQCESRFAGSFHTDIIFQIAKNSAYH